MEADEPGGNWEKYRLNNLVRLHRLQELAIYFRFGNDYYIGFFPKNFAFPSNLVKLSLEGCRLPWKDLSVVGSLPLLQVLRLTENSFVGELWKPVEREFPKLKFLLLEWLELNCWEAESSHFPCLECLEINHCHRLREIPPEVGDIPTLKLIYITYSSKGTTDSANRILEEQKRQGNDELEIRFSSRKTYHRGF